MTEGDPLPLRASKGAVLLSVQAQPGARSEGLAGLRAGRLLVKVRAAPEGGKANAAIAALVANALGLPKSAVSLASGATSRSKELALQGLTLDEARARLQGRLDPA